MLEKHCGSAISCAATARNPYKMGTFGAMKKVAAAQALLAFECKKPLVRARILQSEN
jgi:hypothetical protein